MLVDDRTVTDCPVEIQNIDDVVRERIYPNAFNEPNLTNASLRGPIYLINQGRDEPKDLQRPC